MLEKKEYLTVKEVAEITGKSTQSIYKQMAKRLQTYTTKVGNQTMLKKSVLKEVYGIDIEKVGNSCNQVDNQVATDNSTDTIKLLQDTLDTLKQQLEQKDKQIEELHNLLDQEQQLNAINSKKILELEQKNQEPIPEQEQPWFKKLFKKR